MKKFLTAAAASVLMFGATVAPVMAEGSKSDKIEVASATDKNGNDISGKITVTANPTKTATADDVATVIGAGYASVETVEVTATGEVTFPVTIVFKVDGAKDGMTGYAMHYTGSAWEKLDAKVGDGTMTVTFSSLSPVALVLSTASTTKSPDTSNTTGIAVAGIIMMAALAGFVFVASKRHA